MNWRNVKLILSREVRDQLRDRRTLFVIFVLPILLYPLMGMAFFQAAQLMQKYQASVLVVGADHLPESPPLFVEGAMNPQFVSPEEAKLLRIQYPEGELWDGIEAHAAQAAKAREMVQRGEVEVALIFPPDFTEQLQGFRDGLAQQSETLGTVPSPEIHCNTAKEKSQITNVRMLEVLRRWREEIVRENFTLGGVPEAVANPFDWSRVDVADAPHRNAAVWSKVLPFLLLIWALTGAFYPAIDLCAGEKERGTLETLLTSPAERIEIVWGKLLTVMLFSIATAVFNLVSMGITGMFLLSQMPKIGPPPMLSFVWLLFALVPMSALFGALCLALAAFARSSKEGQYYLMPLLLVTLPLVIMPMTGSIDLSLGTSFLPITGVVLLLRMMIEGDYAQALPFVLPVVGVTLVCCWLAIRWAVDLFNTESVLLPESERLDLGLWLKHLMRDKQDTPNVAMALACGVLILMVRFFMSFALSDAQAYEFVSLQLVTQLVVILTPVLLMTVMLTRSPRKTLLLRFPPLLSIIAAAMLAICLHPVVHELQKLVMRLYPLSEELGESLGELNQVLLRYLDTWGTIPGLAWILLGMALMPAVCEELAFRGFILSGFRHMGHKWRAIVLSSVFFGLSHAIFQQSLIATLMGMVIGYIAVQTGSILPGIVYHVCHNALGITIGLFSERYATEDGFLQRLLGTLQEVGYPLPVVICSGFMALGLLYWFSRLKYVKSAEESLQEAIDHHVPQPLTGNASDASA